MQTTSDGSQLCKATLAISQALSGDFETPEMAGEEK